jgi:hypothetical protein
MMDDDMDITIELDKIEDFEEERSLVKKYLNVLDFYRELYSSDNHKSRLIDEYSDLLINEHDILLENEECIKRSFFNCKETISKKDLQNFKKSDPFPLEILDKIACSLSSTCFLDKNFLNVSKDKLIGSGVSGSVFSAKIGDISDLAILKFLKSKGKTDELYNVFSGIDLFHEIFVGISVINTIRKQVPNFIYTYGFLRCDEYKECEMLENLDGTKTTYPIPVIENISDSYTLRSKLESVSLSELISIFIQIILSLRLANDMYGFVHFDLHTDNIMLQKLDDTDIFLYPSTNTATNIKAKRIGWIPRIIDYAYSRVEIGDIELSARRIRFPLVDNLNFITDIYKLCGFIVFNYNSYNEKVDLILKIFFKLKEVLKSRLSTERDWEYYQIYLDILLLNLVLPISKKTTNKIIKDLIGTNIILFLYHQYLIDGDLDFKKEILKKVYYFTPTNLLEFKSWLFGGNKTFVFLDKKIGISQEGIFSDDRMINYPREIFENSLDEIVEISLEMLEKEYPDYNKFLGDVIFGLKEFQGYLGM